MIKLIVLFGMVTVTSYRAVPEQTDSTPTITSIGHHVHPYGVAVSRDLLKSGKICYGDVLFVPGYGLRVVNDTMNIRHTKHIDLFVNSYAEEKSVGVKRLIIGVIQSEMRKCKNESKDKNTTMEVF